MQNDVTDVWGTQMLTRWCQRVLVLDYCVREEYARDRGAKEEHPSHFLIWIWERRTKLIPNLGRESGF